MVTRLQSFRGPTTNRVLEYLEHVEWGLALEHLCSNIIDEGILISESIFNSIKKIGEEMELDSIDWWEK
ncbi:MafI family immunity protein [Paenibacillus sp. NPDC058071]|uniref:MafI family immunity protein n=1 Tax=Paenibacillus sp. NPDC058071 TaxID=3346326 RepID=UPI0036DC8F6B